VGIYAAAFKKGALSASAYADMIASMTLLNRVGTKLAKDAAVHAMTDVTGFGLFGHTMEMARGSDTTIVLKAASVPLLPESAELVRQGFFTGASVRNWASYGSGVRLDGDFPEWQRHLYTDPQTSGGLLIDMQKRSCGGSSMRATLMQALSDLSSRVSPQSRYLIDIDATEQRTQSPLRFAAPDWDDITDLQESAQYAGQPCVKSPRFNPRALTAASGSRPNASTFSFGASIAPIIAMAASGSCSATK